MSEAETETAEAVEDTPTPKARPNSLAVVPWSGEDPKDFFSNREGLISSAVIECTSSLKQEEGDYVGYWLLTQISSWDNERERLVLLTTKYLIIIKYDFIALKIVSDHKVPLEEVDTIVIGQMSYPSESLIPRIDGLATGLSSVFKGYFVRPVLGLTTGFSSFLSCPNASALKSNAFEARSRNMGGVRVMWNRGKELPFSQKWNPFASNIPYSTFTSHPLLWLKDDENEEKRIYSVEDFTVELKRCLDPNVKNFKTCIQYKPILLENYCGLGAWIHNKNSLGFFKIRGKVSF